MSMKTEFFFKNEPREYLIREGVRLVTDSGILKFMKNQTFGELEIFSSNNSQLSYVYLRQIAHVAEENNAVYAIRLKNLDEFKRIIWESSIGKHEFRYEIVKTPDGPDGKDVLYYSKQSNVIIFAYGKNEK